VAANKLRLVELGLAPTVATEVARQISTNTGNVRRLIELGFTPKLAKLMAAAAISSGVSAAALCESGMPSVLAKEFVAQVGGGAAVGGLTPATLPFTPTVRFHANTAPGTMREDGTFQGYCTGGILTVTTWSATTCESLRPDEITPMYVVHPSLPAGTRIRGMPGTGFGQGGTGNYNINSTATVGSSASPVTFTVPTRRAVAVADLMGASGGLSSPDKNGPVVVTDGYGRKAWMFEGGNAGVHAFLQNTTYASDTQNMGWFIVGCHLDLSNNNFLPDEKQIIGLGYAGSGADTAYSGQSPGYVKASAGALIKNGNNTPANENPNFNIKKRMFLGHQLQVIGSCASTADGYNGTTDGNTTNVILINETSSLKSDNFAPRRLKGFQGFTVSNGSKGSNILVYEIVGYFRGELGTNAQVAARAAAVSQALMTAYNIPVITKSLTAIGDSRIAQQGSYYMPDTGYTLGGLLCFPGPDAIPGNVRVQNWGAGGRGIGQMEMTSTFETIGSPFAFASPMAPTMQLGGGNDYFFFLSGSNDTGGATDWPTSAGAVNSNAYVDDLYNGPGYTGAFNGTVPLNANYVNKTGQTGVVIQGSYITSGAPWDVGQSIYKTGSATSSDLTMYQKTAIPTDTPTTVRIDSYGGFVRGLFARGFKGVWIAEPQKSTGASSGLGYFAQRVKDNAVTDTGAAPGGTYSGALAVVDPTAIKVDGKFVFGPDYQDYGQYFVDFIHYTEAGKLAMVNGGENPAIGLRAKIKAVLGA
jgi:hypothetical protein